MTLYQELQLNQAGSKQLIRNTQDKKKKHVIIAVYLFKILLTLAFLCCICHSIHKGIRQ